MALPIRYRVASALCVLAFAILLVVIGRSGPTKSEQVTLAAASVTPSISTPAPIAAANAELEDSRLETTLRELQDGKTCDDRKRAIAKLVELGRTKAVPALEKARSQGKENACLRATAGAAIRALHGTI